MPGPSRPIGVVGSSVLAMSQEGGSDTITVSAPIRRLAEELGEALGTDRHEVLDGPGLDERSAAQRQAFLEELHYALHPPVHERRAPSFGAIVGPSIHPDEWNATTTLAVTRRSIPAHDHARRFADGLSSWVSVLGHPEARLSRNGPASITETGAITDVLGEAASDTSELVVFDRTAGSERDLVVLAGATGATIIQRHPSGVVRAVGGFGVLRWDGIRWQRARPIVERLDALADTLGTPVPHPLSQLVEFAVHDLGARNIGALLLYSHRDDPPPTFELRLPEPPPLMVGRPADLAPLRHVLAQIDGAAVFDRRGVLRHLGVRLIPSAEAEADVDGLRGMRHTSARRYSFDDPDATVIVVSEDGPVTLLRNGEVVRTTPLPPHPSPTGHTI